MKIAITESQYNLIVEQFTFFPDPRTPEQLKDFSDTFWNYCSANKELCYSVGEIALWFVPYVGPYLSSALGIVQGIDYMSHGQKTLGAIYMLLSPLMLSKIIRIGKMTNTIQPKTMQTLMTIQKSGLPIFKTQGEQQLFSWLDKNYGPKYKAEFMADLNKLAQSKEVGSEIKKTLGDELNKLRNSPEIFNKLSGEKKQQVTKVLNDLGYRFNAPSGPKN